VALAELGASASTIGGLLAIGAAAAVAVRPLAPWLARRMGGAPRVLLASTGVGAVSLAGMGWAQAIWVFVPLLLALGAAAGASLPLTLSIVARDVDAAARGRAFGLRLVVNRAVQLVAPPAVGVAIALAGIAAGFAAAAIVLLGVAGAVTGVTRRRG
jgi:MFS family permease